MPSVLLIFVSVQDSKDICKHFVVQFFCCLGVANNLLIIHFSAGFSSMLWFGWGLCRNSRRWSASLNRLPKSWLSLVPSAPTAAPELGRCASNGRPMRITSWHRAMRTNSVGFSPSWESTASASAFSFGSSRTCSCSIFSWYFHYFYAFYEEFNPFPHHLQYKIKWRVPMWYNCLLFSQYQCIAPVPSLL